MHFATMENMETREGNLKCTSPRTNQLTSRDRHSNTDGRVAEPAEPLSLANGWWVKRSIFCENISLLIHCTFGVDLLWHFTSSPSFQLQRARTPSRANRPNRPNRAVVDEQQTWRHIPDTDTLAARYCYALSCSNAQLHSSVTIRTVV